MYFSKLRIDPTDPEVVYFGGVDLHQTLDGGKTVNTAGSVADPLGSSHHLGQPGEPESRADWQRRRAGDLVRPGEVVAVPAQPAGRALLSRERRHGDAVQRLRRHAGQLQLVRPERRARFSGHRQLSLDDAARWRRLRRAPGSEGLPHRVQRVSGRQHRPRRQADRRDDIHPAGGGAWRAGVPLALGYADDPVAARCPCALHRRQSRVPLARSRPDMDPGESGSDHQPEPRRDRHDGREG